MGSRDEFFAAVAFIDKHKIHPIVDSVLEGIEHAEDGFQLLKQGGQFGKVRSRLLSLPLFHAVLSLEITDRPYRSQVVINIAKDESPKL